MVRSIRPCPQCHFAYVPQSPCSAFAGADCDHGVFRRRSRGPDDDGRGRMISDPRTVRCPRTRHRTPRQERRAQTRAALLDAAERLWAERGIRGASLDEIAAQAGLTKGAVYSNFAGKPTCSSPCSSATRRPIPALGAVPDLRGSERSPDERRADAGTALRRAAVRRGDPHAGAAAGGAVAVRHARLLGRLADRRLVPHPPGGARRRPRGRVLGDVRPRTGRPWPWRSSSGWRSSTCSTPSGCPAELYGSGIGLLLGPSAEDAPPGP